MKSEIVVIVWNELKRTKDCLKSIILKTKAPYELLIIDNGSDVETSQYLKDFTSLYNDRVNLIRNEENLGYLKAANQGLRHSKADFVCLLNNDTLVTEDWLNELVYLALENPGLGLLNPSSNTLGQKTNIKDIDNYAQSLKRYHGQFEEMAQASGFCMFIRREVIDKIGVFDEIYGRGYFEDTDYSRRASQAGFTIARCKASYVYHYEGTSFLKFKDHNKMFKENQKIFYSRWGKPKRIFIEARDGLGNGDKEECLRLARKGNWIIIAEEKNAKIKNINHSNIKSLLYNRRLFILKCLFRIIRRIKKRYDILLIQSDRLRRILKIMRVFHKARVTSFKDIRGL